MNGFFGLVRIFLRIEKKLNQIFDVLQLLASFLRDRETISPVTWLDNQDVMLILKISERTLRRHRLEGRIPFCQIKGKYYYRQADIDDMLGRSAKKIG
jgi:hypothetical protein